VDVSKRGAYATVTPVAEIFNATFDEMMKLVDRLPERPAYAPTSRLV